MAGSVRWRHRIGQHVKQTGGAQKLASLAVGAVDVVGDPDVDQVHHVDGELGI